MGTEPFVISNVMRACEAAWGRVREHHPDLPEVVFVPASGVAPRSLQKLGHWAKRGWIVEGEGVAFVRGEVMVASEAFERGAHGLLGTILHEAAHALATARGIEDVSRNGRYHNQRYRALAQEVGLTCERAGPHGWAWTALTPEAAALYAPEIDGLAVLLTGYRNLRPQRDRQPQGRQLYRCSCGRQVRASPRVMALGSVTCGVCAQPFVHVSPHGPHAAADLLK